MWCQVRDCEYLPPGNGQTKVEPGEGEQPDLLPNIWFKVKLTGDLARFSYTVTDCDGKVGSEGISFKTMIENDDKEYNEDIELKNSMIERPVS